MELLGFTEFTHKSSTKGVPILGLQGALHLNPTLDPHQNEAVVQMWLEVQLKPLLHSITKHFLSCLSTKNFSCSTYQTVYVQAGEDPARVKELSHHFSEMNPVRQKWIYTFFMYPFLSGDGIDGCVRRNETSEDWLMKNFGAFKAMAQLQDFSTLNVAFSGLEVLHLLSPVQKAELLMRPEVASLDNDTLTFIFHDLLTGGSHPKPTAFPGGSHNWTTLPYLPTHHPPTTHDPYLPSSPHSGLRVRERDASEIKSTVFTQFLLSWSLSELADMYRPTNASVGPQAPAFDVTDVEDWYRQVVTPLLRRFLPNTEAVMHENITLAFHRLLYLTDAVANVANVLHCAARSDLPMTEHTIMRLVQELTGRLNSLVRELAKANFSELASEFRQIFTGKEPPTLPQEHLNDPSFIALWFKTAELLLLPLRTPPEKDIVIDRVFDFLLESPEDRRLSEVLSSLVRLARECLVTQFNARCQDRWKSAHSLNASGNVILGLWSLTNRRTSQPTSWRHS
ncbi:unnamed protein product [Tetraodon nigroviridis]|uniref:(spotted green pufferfish) hypothetical protein n=1 Tax=Tetraodon nigroviridis TaxID=99883 RepID=Q4SMK9_TETNG|nr:unnamed protein product [Tetraodon nigroviridis]